MRRIPEITLRCRAVLLDLDGTLVESAPTILRTWKRWAERNSIPFEAIERVVHGRRGIDTIRLVAPSLDAAREEAALEAEEIADMEGVRLCPGAAELMQKLQASPYAIVTSGSRRSAEARLKHVGLPIPSVLIDGDEVKAGKPAADGYLIAARRLKMEARDCVVLEDSPVGIEAGKAASMRVIAVASTHAAEELRQADIVIRQLGNIDLRTSERGLIILVQH